MNRYCIFLGILLLMASFSYADTGTYEIQKQNVTLTILDNGSTEIAYDVSMYVSGGNIPWVTIGLPNSNFTVISFSGAAISAKPKNSYGWTGAYINLNKTYYSGESFSFQLKVLQQGLIKSYSEGKYSFDFIPVWWDNAIIKEMKITIIPPNKTSSVTTTSQPSSFEDNSIVWFYTNINHGERKEVGIILDSNAFTFNPVEINQNNSNIIPIIVSDPIINLSIGLCFLILVGCFLLYIFKLLAPDAYDDLRVSLLSNSLEIKRKINLTCPNDNKRLIKSEIQGTTIDICEECGGIFFDRGEIEKLIKKSLDEKEINKKFSITGESLYKKTPIQCLRCSGDVEKISKTVDGKKCSIYVCEDCSSIWINKGIYQLIKDKRIEQEKLQKERLDKKKEDEDKDDYLFPVAWWIFASHIGSTGSASSASFSGGEGFSGGGSGGSYSSSSSSCVACACVAACACACACAGGGAAGCSPKNTIESKYPQINLKKLINV